MATARGTATLLNASHLGQRISSVARWALADGAMIFGQANRILSTRLFVTHIVASVRHAVAHLTGRAVVIVDTRNTLTAVEGIIRIPGVGARRALTLCLMIVGNANGTWPTLDALAGGTTAERLRSLLLDAGLRLGALCIAAALVFPLWLAAITIVGITHEATKAITASLMLTSNTDRVRWAGEGITDGNALEHAEDIGTAGGGVGTILIAGTVGQGGLLTGGDHRVPHKAVRTVANGMSCWVNLAQLVGTADDIRAEVDALTSAQGSRLATESTLAILVRFAFIFQIWHLPFRLATHLQITGIAKVSIGANTRRAMIIGHAECIGSTLNLRAGIDALAQSLAQLETDLSLSAVGIIAALSTNAAALAEIVWISHIAQWAQTLASITDGTRTTSCLRAEVLAVTRLATVSVGTLHSLTALTLRGILAELALDGLATAVGIASMSDQAKALKATGRVEANCI